jgi:hypothetical protein
MIFNPIEHISALAYQEKQGDFRMQMVVVFFQWIKQYVYLIIFAGVSKNLYEAVEVG